MPTNPARPRKRLGHGLATMQVMLGLPKWAAAGCAAEAGWLEEIEPLWDRYAKRVLWPGTLLKTLDEVAEGSPRTAGRWLKSWLTDRRVPGTLSLGGRAWALDLPWGMDLEGGLMLDASPIQALPERLRVGADLYLDRSLIASLPRGLKVGAGLWLRHCPHWDGRIPEDARVEGRVFTEPHPHGLRLEAWRARFPLGERPDLMGAPEAQ